MLVNSNIFFQNHAVSKIIKCDYKRQYKYNESAYLFSVEGNLIHILQLLMVAAAREFCKDENSIQLQKVEIRLKNF